MASKSKKEYSYLRDVTTKFCRHKAALVGSITLILLTLIVVFLPMITSIDPYTTNATAHNAMPSAEHLLGTDEIGRDLFARLIYGGRTSLLVGILSTLISLLIGVPLGLIAGYYRGPVETFIMRLTDVFMSFPSMILIMVLVAVFGTSITSVTVVIGITGWTQFARLVYMDTLSTRERQYVEAAVSSGVRDFSLITKYILPNTFSPVMVTFTFRTANAILTESALSYMGYGIKPPMASWGNILNYAQSLTTLTMRPWVWIPAGLLLLITVLSINFIGDGLRDALDPKTKV